MSWNGPLFVVGMPRSGTKLLRTLLNQHPRISILGVETEFLPLWQRRWAGFGDLSDRVAFQRFYDWNLKLTYFYLFKQEVGPVIGAQAWFDLCNGKFDIGSVFEALARHDAGAAADANIIWGDKSPSYVRHIAYLHETFPDARIIHIIRDVRDYAVSLRKGFGKDILRSSQRWTDDVRQAHIEGLRIGQRNYAEIRYENLIGSPEAEMRRLCSFLDIEFVSDLTRLHTPAERAYEHQRGVGTERTEIVSNNNEKWRSSMPPAQRAKIEAIACDTMSLMGYEVAKNLAPQRLSPISMALRQAFDGFNLLRSNSRFGLLEAVKFYGTAYWTGAPDHISRD